MSIKVIPHEPVVDERPISELNFGYNEFGEEDRLGEATWMRKKLAALDVQTAQGIVDLGCTGAIFSLTVGEIARFRLGLAGSGVGLPCYVPITRFCLAHNTIGGLESGQVSRHSENVEKISRELTPVEAAKVRLMDKSRRIDKDTIVDTQKAVSSLLGGRDQEALREALTEPQDQVLDLDKSYSDPQTNLINASLTPRSVSWKCAEHRDLNWGCRHCVAQAIVEGPLVPVLRIGQHENDNLDMTPEEIQGYMDRGAPFEVLVRAAKFKTGLVRE
jgi:hypothetical protein